ncbi:MAG TPA: sigma-70 family RNA polymerase sigma factor [Candidatus Limnocylindrales bacterium]
MTVDAITTDHAERAEMLEAAFLAHAAGLRGRLTSLTRDPAASEDIVGECFLRLATEIDAGRPPVDAGAWLHRVGRNLAISRARRNAVATKAMPGLLDRGVAPSPEDAVVDRERDEILYEALASLAGGDRRIVVLAAKGYRPEEIAQLIGCTGAATRTRLCRARGRLRSHLVASMPA